MKTNLRISFAITLVLLLGAKGFAQFLKAESKAQMNQGADDFWVEVNTNHEWFHHPVGRSIDTVYVASQRGVYRSVDSCQTWQCIGFEDTSIDWVYLSEDNELYASICSNTPIFKWDGNSWNLLGHASFSAPRSFLKSSDGTLYLGDDRGIRISFDGGVTWWTYWENPNQGVTYVNGLIELDDGTLFACLTNSSDYHIGVIRSIDHGLSWKSVGLDENYLISFAKSPDGTVYAGCDGYNNDEDVGVFRTEDNGETWEMLNGGFRVNSIVIDDNDNVYIAQIDFQGLYRSNDGGYNYENISSGMDYIQTGLALLPDGYMLSYEYNGSVFFGKMFVSRESVYTPFELDVIAEPSDGGVSVGSGTYLFGERAHLSATANENYQFVGWTNQDGDTISTDPEYAHMVARGGQITAHFVSIEAVEETEGAAFTLCPNPASGVVRIEGVEADEVWFYNALGQVVKRVRNSNEVSLEGLVEGVYLVRIRDKEGRIFLEKVMVR